MLENVENQRNLRLLCARITSSIVSEASIDSILQFEGLIPSLIALLEAPNGIREEKQELKEHAIETLNEIVKTQEGVEAILNQRQKEEMEILMEGIGTVVQDNSNNNQNNRNKNGIKNALNIIETLSKQSQFYEFSNVLYSVTTLFKLSFLILKPTNETKFQAKQQDEEEEYKQEEGQEGIKGVEEEREEEEEEVEQVLKVYLNLSSVESSTIHRFLQENGQIIEPLILLLAFKTQKTPKQDQ